MKRPFLLLACLAFGLPSFGQITLNQSSVPIPSDTLKYSDVTSQVTTPPAIGNDMIWDYSGLDISSNITGVFYPSVSNDTAHPTAQFSRSGFIKSITPDAGFDYSNFYKINSDGQLGVGIHIPEQSYGLLQYTGIPTDTLRVLAADIDIDSMPINYIKFPATAGSNWQSSPRFAVNMQLTVSSASLNNAPMQEVYYRVNKDSVIGWGTLRLFDDNGDTVNLSVLMVQSIKYTVDSFYLNGTPAPTILMNTFGVAQGQKTDKVYSRSFYREGIYGPQMTFNYQDSTFTNLDSVGGCFVNIDIPVNTGITNLGTTSNGLVYPNPVTNHSFYIRSSKGQAVTSVKLYDIRGRQIKAVTDNENGLIKVTAANAARGIYIFKAFGSSGQVITRGKVVFTR